MFLRDETVSDDTVNGDLQFFVVGYLLVIIYLAVMLGSFSRINHKVYLAISAIAVIGLSIGISYGLGSAFQLKYTGVHNVLPFLLLGEWYFFLCFLTRKIKEQIRFDVR